MRQFWMIVCIGSVVLAWLSRAVVRSVPMHIGQRDTRREDALWLVSMGLMLLFGLLALVALRFWLLAQ